MPQINVLIVEDDLTTQEMARMVLENAGYGVSVARSAEEAEKVLRSLWPDIVLMDRELPGMTGLELTRRLKQAEETSGITIIAFSARQSVIDNELAVAAGSDGFVHKPFTVRGLLQTIAWHVAAREAATTGRFAAGLAEETPTPGDAAWHTSAATARRSDATSHLFGGFMNMSRNIIISGLLVVAAAASASAQTATQTVTFQVDAINQVAVSGSPTLAITAAVAGGAPTTVTSTGNTWAVTTNQSNAKITASIGSAMPSGVTLSANLAAPAGATSAGMVGIGTSAVDVVTGITKLNASGLALTYQLEATAGAGVVASTTRVVTYTITGGV
ncbi:MAG TPA: response regulator [Gemmatimonadaceae bacterium]|nr:response regulator [Gemmatimonadaceae bacterium]